MTEQQQLLAKLERAEALFRQTYIKSWVNEWWSEVLENRQDVTPSDWINASIIMMEILIDSQELDPDRREKLVFEVVGEIHKRLSKAPGSATAS